MATETVPADIAAAIESLHQRAFLQGALKPGTPQGDEAERKAYAARAALDAVILIHLRKADELKAALERITSGGV